MPRKLKTYVTSIGFFEQAVAAPSMKAALEAWGARKNLFHQGFAWETDDPAIVAAAMAKPGVVLKRAVGSTGAFTQNPALPKSLPVVSPKARPARRSKPKSKPSERKSAKVVNLAEARAARQAAAAFEKEQARREEENERQEAAARKERARREKSVDNAKAALEKARLRHETIATGIATARANLDRREEREAGRWKTERKRLEAAIRKA